MPVAVIGTRARDAERPAADRAGRRHAVVHDPIQPPALEAPTARDAKALADRVHAIVAATVERQPTVQTRTAVTDLLTLPFCNSAILPSCNVMSPPSSRPAAAASGLAAPCPSSCWPSAGVRARAQRRAVSRASRGRRGRRRAAGRARRRSAAVPDGRAEAAASGGRRRAAAGFRVECVQRRQRSKRRDRDPRCGAAVCQSPDLVSRTIAAAAESRRRAGGAAGRAIR